MLLASSHVHGSSARRHWPGLLAGFITAWLSSVGDGAAQEFLPPVAPWRGASEALVAPADHPWITPAEKTGLVDSPTYDETVGYLKRLAAASPLLSLKPFGTSAQGRTLYVVVASAERAFTPEALRSGGKPTLLAQAGIHAGEIDGKDAGLMLLRDIAFTGKTGLLERANFLFVPIFNADGHERSSQWNRPNQRGPVHQGWRTTAQNLNLNRDYMKADSPEMQAMLGLIQQWSPALYLDLHVTDGMDYQYDITFGYNGDPGVFAWSSRVGRWLNGTFRPAAEAALKAAGHIPGPLIEEQDPRDPGKGLVAGVQMPRYSGGYGDLRHLASVLVENHSLKPYRQRVLGTYVLLEAALRTLGTRGGELLDAVAADIAHPRDVLPMNWDRSGGIRWGGQGDDFDGRPFSREFLGVAHETYVSAATGQREIRWLGVPRNYPEVAVTVDRPQVLLRRPKAYWVPVTKPDVIARLKWHGIRVDSLSEPRTREVEMYRLVNPQIQRGSGVHPFESRHTLKTGVKAETRTETFPAGSVRVPTDQPLGELAMALLEPECNDSLLAWGFFLEILQRTEYIEGYAMAPLAERMLATDAALKAEFDAKLRADPAFAKSGTARLQWFYQRSRYYDDRYLLYPVGVER